jgi:hypothetical protein
VLGGTLLNWNAPSLPVLAVRLYPVTAFSMVTEAFCTTALFGSITTPLTVPAVPSDWAAAGLNAAKVINNKKSVSAAFRSPDRLIIAFPCLFQVQQTFPC